ncbi:hypothetical protein KCU85_g3971, partial [Aureobasidium melanogenum]
MSTKKLFSTADQLWETFDNVDQELGPGTMNAGGNVVLHPTGHWYDDDAVEVYGKKACALEALQIIRQKNWLEQGLRKDGVREYWSLERLIAAAMEYSASDYAHLMTVFFVEWEKDLKPDGRTIKNKEQWTRWCEIHLVRHHRTAKAVRCLDVFEALGLLYPGWWKQVYAHNHNTTVPNATYASPWDDQPSANIAEMRELDQKYARVPFASPAQVQAASQAASAAIQSAPVMRHQKSRKDGRSRKRNKRTQTTHFQEDLEELDDAYDETALNDVYEETAPAKDSDNESEESFVPEDYYPDYVHEYDATMGKPATTYPQLPHTVGFAPAADAWRDLGREGFEGATRNNPEFNATKIIDSVSKEAIPSGSGTFPRIQPAPAKPPATVALTDLNWADIDERDFRHIVEQVDADFPPSQNQDQNDNTLRDFLPDVRNDCSNPDYLLSERVAMRNNIYNAVAGYKKVPAAELARRQAERQAELARHQDDLAHRKAALHSGTLLMEDEEVIWGYVDEFEDPPGKVWPPEYTNNNPLWPLKN